MVTTIPEPLGLDVRALPRRPLVYGRAPAVQVDADALALIAADQIAQRQSYRVAVARAAAEAADSGVWSVGGYALRWDALTRRPVPPHGLRECVAMGAFRDSLKHVTIEFEHAAGWILGITGDGSARVWEDAKGLAFLLPRPGPNIVRGVREAILTDVSVAFGDERGRVCQSPVTGPFMRIERATLCSVCFVARAAYPSCEVRLVPRPAGA
jgi:phage head maturation protease